MISKNLSAFLLMIRHCEGTYTTDDEGYRALFGWIKGNGKVIKSYADHPRKYTPYTDHAGEKLQTSAAGAYQMIVGTYDALKKRGIMKDFSPSEQDKGAIELIREKGALKDIESGAFGTAITKVRKIWASLPGSGSNQPEKSMTAARKWYSDAGGTFA